MWAYRTSGPGTSSSEDELNCIEKRAASNKRNLSKMSFDGCLFWAIRITLPKAELEGTQTLKELGNSWTITTRQSASPRSLKTPAPITESMMCLYPYGKEGFLLISRVPRALSTSQLAV